MSWPQSLWEDVNNVGGDGGSAFSMVAKIGAMVQNIRVSRTTTGKQSLCGLEVTFTDGSKQTTGKTTSDFKDLTLGTGETITSMTLWGNGVGTRTGRIQFMTSKNQNFDHGCDTSGQTPYSTNVGSGFLLGFAGSSGDEIDFMGAILLKQVQKTYVDNITYPGFDPASTAGLQVIALLEEDATWSGEPHTFTFSGSPSKTATTTWLSTFTTSFGFELSFTAGVPEIASVGGKGTWTIGGSYQWGGMKSETITLGFSDSHMIAKASDAIKCTATCYEGNLDISYTGDLNIVTKDGQTYKIPTSGTLNQVTYSKVIVSISPLGADVPNVGTASTGNNFAVSEDLAAAANTEEGDGEADGEEVDEEEADGEEADGEEADEEQDQEADAEDSEAEDAEGAEEGTEVPEEADAEDFEEDEIDPGAEEPEDGEEAEADRPEAETEVPEEGGEEEEQPEEGGEVEAEEPEDAEEQPEEGDEEEDPEEEEVPEEEPEEGVEAAEEEEAEE